MAALKKKSFFEKLTGGLKLDDDSYEALEDTVDEKPVRQNEQGLSWVEEENEEGQLTVDVYQTPTDIVIETMVAGVRPEDISITITRDMAIIKGKREMSRIIDEENFFLKELYWGTFSRTISLPQEVEAEEAEATEKHGLLIVKIPKIDKEKKTNLKVKSM